MHAHEVLRTDLAGGRDRVVAVPGQPSGLGCGAALLVMPALAVAKRRTGRALGSRTLVADSAETAFCAYTSAAVSHTSVTAGAGGSAMSQACSALIKGPGFFLDRWKVRLLVKSSPQVGSPLCRARSTMGRKSFTFSVSTQRCCAHAQANTRLG
jgi:hypothetical protein